MSRPRLPVETVSISILSRLPSFIAEPLPNARSIWASAASSAFCRSVPEFCTLGASTPLPMTFNCAAMFPLSPCQCKRSLALQIGGRAPPEGRCVPYSFRENNRGTSKAGPAIASRPGPRGQPGIPAAAQFSSQEPLHRMSGLARRKESKDADQVRFEKEFVELEERKLKQQEEFEQEQRQQEEITLAEAARASLRLGG